MSAGLLNLAPKKPPIKTPAPDITKVVAAITEAAKTVFEISPELSTATGRAINVIPMVSASMLVAIAAASIVFMLRSAFFSHSYPSSGVSSFERASLSMLRPRIMNTAKQIHLENLPIKDANPYPAK